MFSIAATVTCGHKEAIAVVFISGPNNTLKDAKAKKDTVVELFKAWPCASIMKHVVRQFIGLSTRI